MDLGSALSSTGSPPEPVEAAPPGSQLVPSEPLSKNPPSLDMLPVELLPDLFLYLDSPRDVLSFALCSKTLYNTVTMTMVVRAAVFHGDARIQ
jgi:hypothetical protein